MTGIKGCRQVRKDQNKQLTTILLVQALFYCASVSLIIFTTKDSYFSQCCNTVLTISFVISATEPF